MSDREETALERAVLSGDKMALHALKALWSRNPEPTTTLVQVDTPNALHTTSLRWDACLAPPIWFARGVAMRSFQLELHYATGYISPVRTSLEKLGDRTIAIILTGENPDG